MDKDIIRVRDPVLPQVKKPQSTVTTATKRRAALITLKLRKEFAPDTLLTKSNYTPEKFIKLKNSPEEYAMFKIATANSIAKKRLESIRFNNFKKRSIASSVNKIHGKVKVCNGCGVERGLSAFDKNFGTKNSSKVRRSYCYMCRKKYNKEYWAKRKERLLNDSM